MHLRSFRNLESERYSMSHVLEIIRHGSDKEMEMELPLGSIGKKQTKYAYPEAKSSVHRAWSGCCAEC